MTEDTLSPLDSRLSWALRLLLLVLLVASPWPFGSATPRPAALLTAGMYVLFVVWGIYLLGTQRASRLAWPSWGWVAAAMGLGLLQLVPFPVEWIRLAAPGAAATHVPENEAARLVLSAGAQALSIEPFTTSIEWLRRGALAATFFLATQLFSGRTEQKLLVRAVTLTGVALSLFAVYQKSRWGTVLYGRFPTESGTPFGPFVNHNHFAGWVEMSAIVALGGAFAALHRRTAEAILLGGSSLVMMIALVFSKSRGGLLALAVGLSFMTWFVLKRRGARAVGLVAVTAAAVVSAVLFLLPATSLEPIGRRWSASPSKDLSLQFRLSLWSDAMGLARSSPLLGTGLGTFGAAIPTFRRDGDEIRAEFAESDFIELLCEAGIVGVVLFLGFAASVGRRTISKLSSEQGPLLLGVAAAALALFAHSVFDFNTRVPANAFFAAILLGTLASAGPASAASVPARRYALLSFAVVLSGLAAAWSLRVGFSRANVREVDLSLARPEEFTALAERLAQASSLAPNNPEVPFKWGQLYSEQAYRAQEHARYRELRLEQARDAFTRAVCLSPARGRYWFELAWTEANLRNEERARPLFDYAIRLEPAWSRLRANYALYLASRGSIELSIAQLEQARRLRPGLDPYEAVSILGPFVADDPSLLRRAAGEGREAERALALYASERTHKTREQAP